MQLVSITKGGSEYEVEFAVWTKIVVRDNWVRVDLYKLVYVVRLHIVLTVYTAQHANILFILQLYSTAIQ